MAQKIFDILPPQKEKKSIVSSKSRGERKKVFFKFSLRKKFFLLISFFFLLFFVLSFEFSKIKIKIWPQTEAVNLQLEIQLDKDVQNLDFENKIIPGKIFEIEKSFSEEFPTTGKVQKYAQGKIRLYNNFTTQEEIWREKTRFLSKEGKLFLSKNKIVVPGAEIKNGKIVPSFVDVEVVAAQPGADYNIGPTTFSIVAFRGTPRYDKYYGESLEAMSGGGEVSQVRKSDLENAERTLIEKVKRTMESIIKQEIPPDFVFLGETLDTKVLEKMPLAKEGQEVEKFLFQVKTKASLLSFKKEDLESFLINYILNQIPKEKEIFKESLKISHSLEKIDSPLAKATLSVNVSAQIYPKLDLKDLKKSLAGKSFQKAKNFLEQQPEILKVEARLFPFWVKKIPKDLEKIEIEYPIID